MNSFSVSHQKTTSQIYKLNLYHKPLQAFAFLDSTAPINKRLEGFGFYHHTKQKDVAKCNIPLKDYKLARR